MNLSNELHDLIVYYEFKRGPIFEILRRHNISAEDEYFLRNYTYDETGENANVIEEMLARIKRARQNNYYYITFDVQGNFNQGTFATNPFFHYPRLNLETKVLTLWNENPELFQLDNPAIPSHRQHYVCFFAENISYFFTDAPDEPMLHADIDDAALFSEFHRDYFDRRDAEYVGEMQLQIHNETDNLHYFFDYLHT